MGTADRRLRPTHRRLLGYVTDPVISIKMQAILRLAAGGGKGVKWQLLLGLNSKLDSPWAVWQAIICKSHHVFWAR